MATEAAAQPSMTTILDNVEREIGPDNVTKYAPPKHRVNLPGNGELEHIQADLRKTLAELADHQRRLVSYCDNLKVSIDAMTRGVG